MNMRQWSVVIFLWLLVSGHWLVVSGQWSVVSGQWSVAGLTITQTDCTRLDRNFWC